MADSLNVQIKTILSQPTEADINKFVSTVQKQLGKVPLKSGSSGGIKVLDETEIDRYKKHMENALSSLKTSLKGSDISIFDSTKINKEISSFSNSLKNLSGGTNNNTIKDLNLQFETLKTRIGNVSSEAGKHSQGITDLISKYSSWYLLAGAVTGVIGSLKEGITFINELNKSMTNIQMITGMNSTQVQNLTKDYANLAGQLHETTQGIMEASEEFLRAGNDQNQTAELLKSSTVMSKIAGQSQAESAQSMISIMNAYKLSASDMMSIVDKMVAIDNSSATSTKELSEAIQKSAASAQESGVTFEQLASWIGTISSVSRQSASTIGASINSILARFNSIKEGKKFDPENQPLNNVEKALNRVGIAMRSDSTTFKSFNDIINEVSTKWSQWNDVQKNEIATAIAGTYQRNKFLTLMQNMNMALDMQTTEANSAGNAMNRYATYAESTEAKINDLKNTLQQMWMNLIQSSTINSVVTGITSIINSLNNLVQGFGGLKTAILLTIDAMVLFKASAINGVLTSIIGYITEFGIAETATLGLSMAVKGLSAVFATVTSPVGLLIGALSLVTLGITSYYNYQEELKKKTEETQKAQTDFNSALDDFNKTLDVTKIQAATNALEELKKATDYTENVQKINELKEKIETLKETAANNPLYANDANISIDELSKELEVLEGKTKQVTDAQDELTKSSEMATAIDYKSVEANVRKISTKYQEATANANLVKQYEVVYDKLSQGIELSDQEKQLNDKLIEQYPQYVSLIDKKNNVLGVSIDALKTNTDLQLKLAEVEFNEYKLSIQDSAKKTNALIDDTEKRIQAIDAEITAMEALENKYANLAEENPDDTSLLKTYWRAVSKSADDRTEIVEAQNKLAKLKVTSNAYDSILNANFDDLMNGSSGSGSSYIPESTGTTKKTSTSTYSEQDQPEKLAQIDRYYELNQLLAENNNLLDKNKALQETATNEEKLDLMDKEIDLMKQRQDLLHQEAGSWSDEANAFTGVRGERQEITGSSLLSNLGFNFEGEGDNVQLTNYQERITALYDELNSHRADKDKTYYKSLKENIDDAETLIKRFFSIQTDELPKLSNEYLKLDKSIGDTGNDKISLLFKQSENDAQGLNDALTDAKNTIAGLADDDIQGKMKAYQAEWKANNDLIWYWNQEMGKFAEGSDKWLEAKKYVDEYTKGLNESSKAMDELNKKQIETTKKQSDDSLKLYEDAIKQVEDLLKKKYEAEEKAVEKAYNAQKDSLDKSLDDYKNWVSDTLDEKQKLYDTEDYNDKVNESSKKINEYQTEIDKYSSAANNGDMEAIAKISELQKSKDEEQKNLKETQTNRLRNLEKKAYQDNQTTYERYIKSQQEANERNYNSYKEIMDRKTSDTALALEAQNILANSNLKTVENTLNELFTVTGENATNAGKIVQNELIDKLVKLQNIGSNLESITKSSSRNYGNNPLGMSTEDFQTYIGNKKAWTDGSVTQEQIQTNADLRRKYGISNDVYTYADLKGYYANGTLSAIGGLSRVNEGDDNGIKGTELRVLNSGDGVLTSKITSQLISLAQNVPSILNNLRPNISIPQFSSQLSGASDINVSFGSLLTVGQLTNMSQGELNSMIDKASDVAITKIKNALYKRGR